VYAVYQDGFSKTFRAITDGVSVVVAEADHRTRRAVLRREVAELREGLGLGRGGRDRRLGDGRGVDGCRDGALDEGIRCR
jgi:hypothetical protein